MRINRIKINNFYSIKNMEIDFDSMNGIYVIEGINKDTGGSNGSGKSSIIEAIVWGLFGKTLRKSNEDALVNIYSPKECKVVITVNDTVVIERCRRPSYLKFFVDGEERTQNNMLNTQLLVEEHLGTNYKVFLASSVFGQSNDIEFVSATPDDKRIIIKNFLNIEDLFDLRESVKFLKSEYSQNIKAKDAIIAEYERKIKDEQLKINKIEKTLKEDYLGFEDIDLNDLKEKERFNEKVDSECKNFKNNLAYLNKEFKDYKEKLKANKDPFECGTCGKRLVEAITKDAIQQSMEACKLEIEEVETKIAVAESRKHKLTFSSKQLSDYLVFKNLLNEENLIKANLENFKTSIQDAINVKTDLNNNYEIMRFWEKAFSESGIVRYIIRNILDYFNTKVNFYLSNLSKGKFVLEFNDELTETIKHNGKELSYISLSGGEKRKVGLSVMLGLQSLLSLSDTEESNIIFFDECLENLDTDGIEGLYILLSELKKSKLLFVITHNKALKSMLDSAETLTVIKKNGISSLGKK
jgi:DNA repair exonuclease SbcCD ATPase subunit